MNTKWEAKFKRDHQFGKECFRGLLVRNINGIKQRILCDHARSRKEAALVDAMRLEIPQFLRDA